MGVLTYIKIGAAVVILGVWGKFAWNYYHLAGKIVAFGRKRRSPGFNSGPMSSKMHRRPSRDTGGTSLIFSEMQKKGAAVLLP